MLVTLIFGGNQGDRKALIGEAITEMSSIGKIELCSSLYETAPWGFKSSDSFYNQIVTYETNLDRKSTRLNSSNSSVSRMPSSA